MEYRLFDVIGEGTATSVKVRDFLDDADGPVTFRVNSPGGELYEGLGIMEALRSYDHPVTVIVEGLAASAASFIAVGGADTLVMGSHSELMVHDAHQHRAGNAADLERTAEELNRVSDNLARIYAEKAGRTPEEWREIMRTETWFTATEAVEAGLADEVAEAKRVSRKAFKQDRAQFKYNSRAAAPAPEEIMMNVLKNLADDQEQAATEPGQESAPELTPEQWNRLTAALNLAPTTPTEDVILAVEDLATATKDDLAEVAEDMHAQAMIRNQAAGAVTIDRHAWRDMKRALERGLTLDQQENRLQAEQVVDQAIRLGKAQARQRENWIAAYHQDPDSTLHALNRGKEIPRMEIGYGVDPSGIDSPAPTGWVR